jgi:hypothetical protein
VTCAEAAREGQARPVGESERFIVPGKPGNAGAWHVQPPWKSSSPTWYVRWARGMCNRLTQLEVRIRVASGEVVQIICLALQGRPPAGSGYVRHGRPREPCIGLLLL